MSSSGDDLTWPDYLVIAAHLAITIGVGLWAARRGSRSTSKGYFLAGRDMSWWLVGMSLYVSNIGSSSFIGMAGAASSSGIAVICYELMGLFCIQLLGFVFVPVYHASGVFTMPEYVKKRFGGSRCQLYLAVQALILFVFTKLSAEMYAGALIVKEALGWDIYYSVLLLLGITALYTVVGGLASVIYTDALQTVVIIIGATILSSISMVEVGGYENMVKEFFAAVPSEQHTLRSNSTCGLASDNSLSLIRPADDPNYPWPGVLIGVNILSAWYFCTDQVLVQRLLAAKNTAHAKAGSILAGYMKVLPLFLMVWPGMVARIKFPEVVACATPADCKAACGVEEGCSNVAYIRLVIKLMPSGLKGLMLAAMMAALMSSLTSIFNSGGTVFTMDIWAKLRKSASESEIMIVSRIFVMIFIGVSIAWLPMIETAQGSQLFNYLQSVTSYLAPPVLAVYIIGILWTRANEQGAFWGLLSGLIIGVARMVADWVVPAPPCGAPDTRPFILKDIHFLHFAILVFTFSVAVTVVVSLVTRPLHPMHLYRTTWWTLKEVDGSGDRKSFDGSKEEAAESRAELTTFASTEPIVGALATNDKAHSVQEMNGVKDVTPSAAWRRILLSWLCGGTSTASSTGTAASAAAMPDESAAHYQESWGLRTAVYGNLVVLMCVGVFLLAFFA